MSKLTEGREFLRENYLTKFEGGKEYKVSYLSSKGEESDSTYTPEKDTTIAGMIDGIKKQNDDFFKVIRIDESKKAATKIVESIESRKAELLEIADRYNIENEYYDIDEEIWNEFTPDQKLEEFGWQENPIDIAKELNIPTYQDKIELSDNRTLWEIEEEIDLDYYHMRVEDKLDQMEKEINQKVYALGRSGRHICVDATLDNIIMYDELREIQQSFEKELIEEINNV